MSNTNTNIQITQQNLSKGTLFKFSSTAHYSRNRDTTEYAIISSNLTPISPDYFLSNSSHNGYENTHKCSIVWNNEEHQALIFSFKNYPSQPLFIKLHQGYTNARRNWGNSLPIIQIISTP